MAYMDNKAAGRDKLTTKFDDTAKTSGASTQERGTSVPKRVLTPNTSKYDVGPNLRVRGNDKGTGVFKQPSAEGLNSKRSTKPAAQNPDGQLNRPNPGKAAGKNRT